MYTITVGNKHIQKEVHMEISRELYNCLIQAAEDECFEIRFHDDYSGRCMYGARCFGVSGDPQTIQYLFYLLHRTSKGSVGDAENLVEEADWFFDSMGPVCQDSLGMGMIYYFPDITVAEEENENNEEDSNDE